MIFIFKNGTIFWDISKWNRGQIKQDGGILFFFFFYEIETKLLAFNCKPQIHKKLFESTR